MIRLELSGNETYQHKLSAVRSKSSQDIRLFSLDQYHILWSTGLSKNVEIEVSILLLACNYEKVNQVYMHWMKLQNIVFIRLVFLKDTCQLITKSLYLPNHLQSRFPTVPKCFGQYHLPRLSSSPRSRR